MHFTTLYGCAAAPSACGQGKMTVVREGSREGGGGRGEGGGVIAQVMAH